MNSDQIEMRLVVDKAKRKNTGEVVQKVQTCLFWTDKEYPFSWIGGSPKTVSENLGISKKAACKLLILKIQEKLSTVEDNEVRRRLLSRLQNLECTIKKLLVGDAN